MLPKNNSSDQSLERVVSLLSRIEKLPRLFNYRWNAFRQLRLNYTSLLKAKNVHAELQNLGVPFCKFSWQWYLCIDLRRDLLSQIEDTLIARIISDFQSYESKRLDDVFAEMDRPGKSQYYASVNSLNSTFKELNYWLESDYDPLHEELKERIEECKSNLGKIARQNISGVWLDYKKLGKHSFYYISMLTLLQDFELHKMKHNLESVSSGLEANTEPSTSQSQFSPYEWAAILLFAFESHLLSFPTWKKCAQNFIEVHAIPTTYDYFRKEYYKVRKALYKTYDFPIEILDTILPFVRNHYPKASVKIEGDKKFLQEEQSNNQEIREF